MNKNLLSGTFTIILSVTMFHASSQGYYPMLDSISNNWTYVCNVMPVRIQQPSTICDYNNLFTSTAMDLFTNGDTVLGTTTYQKVHLEEITGSLNDCDFGYIREDTAAQKIYFVDNLFSPEILLYDFSMLIGDSIFLDFSVPFGLYYTDGYYFVDSISNITINAGVRRIFYLSNPNNFTQFPLEWIESVGNPGHLVYTHSLNMGAGWLFFCQDPIARDFYQLLTCFEHNSQKVYFDSCAHAFAYNNGCFDYTDSCNFWNICGSLAEHSPIADWALAPNPTPGPVQIQVQAMRNEHVTLSVIDLKGKLICSQPAELGVGWNSLSYDASGCKSGFYILEMRWREGVLFQKLGVSP